MTGAITIADLAAHRLGREPETGEDYLQARLPMLGGCQGCGATIAAFNAFPSMTGFLRCEHCIAGLGYPTVEEANEDLFEPDGSWPQDDEPDNADDPDYGIPRGC